MNESYETIPPHAWAIGLIDGYISRRLSVQDVYASASRRLARYRSDPALPRDDVYDFAASAWIMSLRFLESKETAVEMDEFFREWSDLIRDQGTTTGHRPGRR